MRFRPYRTAENRIDGIVATFLDITERRRTEDALRASEQNLREQIQLVELSHSPIFVWDFDDGIRQWNRGSEQLYGFTKEEAIGEIKHKLLKTKVPGSSFEAVKKDLLNKGVWRGELEYTTKDGRTLMLEADLELIQVAGRRYVLESTRDITRTKALEARQRLLLSELTHRVKNTLAVVQGMVHQTWRRSGNKEDFIERLDGRLAALASSHNLLLESEWNGADLHRLIQDQLAPYAAGGRLQIKGEPIALSPDVATPFGLVLHELATNAVKYGALSNDKGRVELSWTVTGGNKGRRLKFTWNEKAGPPVKKPSSNGFGAQLIQHGIPGAKVRHEFTRDGVQCMIELPPTETRQDGSADVHSS